MAPGLAEYPSQESTPHPDRLFPADREVRAIARELYGAVRALPIVSPHGHCDPSWFADDQPFPDPAHLLVTPDHYLVRLLYSRGVAMERLGWGPGGEAADPREIWQTFAEHFDLFLGTPSRLWLECTLADVFGVDVRLEAATAGTIYDHLSDCLKRPEFRPRALFERFGVSFLATTESPLDELVHHRAMRAEGWAGAVVPTMRPDDVADPDGPGFVDAIERLGSLAGVDVGTWDGYLAALRARRGEFVALGATATDHGHPSPHTEDLSPSECDRLYRRVLEAARGGRASGGVDLALAERFRGQALTEMVRMSTDDGLVTQLHAGVWRNHHAAVLERFGRDAGADVPVPVDFVGGLHPLLQRFGGRTDAALVLFTVDETTYARELAPLAGHYPLLRLGAPWWFHDSPEGMRRFRRRTTETAGFANLAGFTDDTRAFLSIPARHDVARRVDCGWLAGLVAEHVLTVDDAHTVARLLAHELAHELYRVDAATERVAELNRSS